MTIGTWPEICDICAQSGQRSPTRKLIKSKQTNGDQAKFSHRLSSSSLSSVVLYDSASKRKEGIFFFSDGEDYRAKESGARDTLRNMCKGHL